METFNGLPVIRTTTADKIRNVDTIVCKDMEKYSEWGCSEHLEWISELSGLDRVSLVLLVERGYQVLTNESVSEVWLVSRDYYKSKARLVYDESDDDNDDDA